MKEGDRVRVRFRPFGDATIAECASRLEGKEGTVSELFHVRGGAYTNARVTLDDGEEDVFEVGDLEVQ